MSSADWSHLYRRPTRDEILRLRESHGWEACLERWGYLGERTLASISRGESNALGKFWRREKKEAA
jgi:hypothetical protein